VMRGLWRRYGRRHGPASAGVGEGDFEQLAEEVTGLKLARFLDAALRTTRELPLRRLLATHGVDMALRPAESALDKGGKPAGRDAGALARRPSLGVRTRSEGRDLVVTHVLDGGAAQDAGIAAGDTIIAIAGARPGQGGLDAMLDRRRPGEDVLVHLFRRDELLALPVRLGRARRDTCFLTLPGGRETAPLRRWLDGAAR